MLGGVREGIQFLHRQCAHVGEQDRDLPLGEFVENQAGSLQLFVTEFRMRMQIATNGLQFGMKDDDRSNQIHIFCF